MSADLITPLFTRSDGQYLCARWGRPIVPVVFGTDDTTLAVVKAAVEAVVVMAGHRMAETDPELGANLMFFFVRDWHELLGVKDLDRLIDGLDGLVARLDAAGASQYRAFRFEGAGAIKAAFVFLRIDATLAQMPAADLALLQAVRVILLWSDRAFAQVSPLAQVEGLGVVRPEIAAVIRAAYDRVMPPVARDPSHALRLAARTSLVFP